MKEADELLGVLQSEATHLADDIATAEEGLRMIENELAPARHAVAALVQDDVSAIDMTLGELIERQRHLERVSAALRVGQGLTDGIAAIEREIEPLQQRVDEAVRATDSHALASQCEDGMNAYLAAINVVKPGVWRHNPVAVDLSRSRFTIWVGERRWHSALGGTDTLYLLMAYHYGLLTLSDKPDHHYLTSSASVRSSGASGKRRRKPHISQGPDEYRGPWGLPLS